MPEALEGDYEEGLTMCKKSRDGADPSCLEAKFEGPGCEDWDLCAECADILKGRLDAANLQISELQKTICAGICGADFPGVESGEHMPRCPLRTRCHRAHVPISMPGFYEDGIRSIQCGNCDIQVPLIPPVVSKGNDEKLHCTNCGAVLEDASEKNIRTCFNCA